MGAGNGSNGNGKLKSKETPSKFGSAILVIPGSHDLEYSVPGGFDYAARIARQLNEDGIIQGPISTILSGTAPYVAIKNAAVKGKGVLAIDTFAGRGDAETPRERLIRWADQIGITLPSRIGRLPRLETSEQFVKWLADIGTDFHGMPEDSVRRAGLLWRVPDTPEYVMDHIGEAAWPLGKVARTTGGLFVYQIGATDAYNMTDRDDVTLRAKRESGAGKAQYEKVRAEHKEVTEQLKVVEELLETGIKTFLEQGKLSRQMRKVLYGAGIDPSRSKYKERVGSDEKAGSLQKAVEELQETLMKNYGRLEKKLARQDERLDVLSTLAGPMGPLELVTGQILAPASVLRSVYEGTLAGYIRNLENALGDNLRVETSGYAWWEGDHGHIGLMANSGAKYRRGGQNSPWGNPEKAMQNQALSKFPDGKPVDRIISVMPARDAGAHITIVNEDRAYPLHGVANVHSVALEDTDAARRSGFAEHTTIQGTLAMQQGTHKGGITFSTRGGEYGELHGFTFIRNDKAAEDGQRLLRGEKGPIFGNDAITIRSRSDVHEGAGSHPGEIGPELLLPASIDHEVRLYGKPGVGDIEIANGDMGHFPFYGYGLGDRERAGSSLWIDDLRLKIRQDPQLPAWAREMLMDAVAGAANRLAPRPDVVQLGRLLDPFTQFAADAANNGAAVILGSGNHYRHRMTSSSEGFDIAERIRERLSGDAKDLVITVDDPRPVSDSQWLQKLYSGNKISEIDTPGKRLPYGIVLPNGLIVLDMPTKAGTTQRTILDVVHENDYNGDPYENAVKSANARKIPAPDEWIAAIVRSHTHKPMAGLGVYSVIGTGTDMGSGDLGKRLSGPAQYRAPYVYSAHKPGRMHAVITGEIEVLGDVAKYDAPTLMLAKYIYPDMYGKLDFDEKAAWQGIDAARSEAKAAK